MYGFKNLCEISKVPFDNAHIILNRYTAKYAFYRALNIYHEYITCIHSEHMPYANQNKAQLNRVYIMQNILRAICVNFKIILGSDQ